MGYPEYGCMVVSLDFELMWGILDHEDPMRYADNIRNVSKVVPRLLVVFEKYGIHATWGVVGSLAERGVDDYLAHMPEKKPSYRNVRRSSYSYLELIRDAQPQLFFAPELVELIACTPGQEIGSHTYSHYYCLEEGQTAEELAADLEQARHVLRAFSPTVCSLIVPRNQFNGQYADVLKNEGFCNYRGNERAWFFNSGVLAARAFRLLDNYLPLSGSNTYGYEEITDRNGLKNIRSSRFLRPYSQTLSLLEPLRMKRIIGQMECAAKNKQVFHLWWHPHNFGANTEKNMYVLEKLLCRYRELSDQCGFQSLNMKEMGTLADGI